MAVGATLCGHLMLGLVSNVYLSMVGLVVGTLLAAVFGYGVAGLGSIGWRVAVEIGCITSPARRTVVLGHPPRAVGATRPRIGTRLSPRCRSRSSTRSTVLRLPETYHLMKQGTGYYAAFRQAVTECISMGFVLHYDRSDFNCMVHLAGQKKTSCNYLLITKNV